MGWERLTTLTLPPGALPGTQAVAAINTWMAQQGYELLPADGARMGIDVKAAQEGKISIPVPTAQGSEFLVECSAPDARNQRVLTVWLKGGGKPFNQTFWVTFAAAAVLLGGVLIYMEFKK